MYPARVLIRVAAELETFAGRHGCWEWRGARSGAGRAILSYFHQKAQHWAAVHVAAYLLRVGPIPEGQEPVSACGNAACVNPVHLGLAPAPVEHRAVLEPARAAPTAALPELSAAVRSRTRLDPAAVAAILASSEPASVLAARYGVCPSTIGDIRASRTWRHIPRA